MKCILIASCPWATSTGLDNVLECNDGSRCNGVTDGWTCCENRGMRSKCPLNFPAMCAKPNCAWGDYCCYEKDRCLSSLGGLRSCWYSNRVITILRTRRTIQKYTKVPNFNQSISMIQPEWAWEDHTYLNYGLVDNIFAIDFRCIDI